MKTKSINYYLLSVLCFVSVSCNNINPLEPEPLPERKLAIVKLSSEMLNRIFVSPVVDSAYTAGNNITLFYGNVLVLNNPTKDDLEFAEFTQSKLKIVGTTPYLRLDNGYAIIDWKWAQFHPLSGENRRPMHYDERPSTCIAYSTNRFYNIQITNEKYFLLGTNWNELTSLTTQWELAEGMPIEIPEVRYIDCIKIEEYGNYKNGLKELQKKYHISRIYDLSMLYSKSEEDGKQFIEECNILQSSYVETLNLMIKNNDFEKWTTQWK